MSLTPNEISEGNELLAKFMDLKPRQIVGYDSNGNKLTLDGYDYEIDGYEFIRPIEYVSKSFQSSDVVYHKVISPYSMRYIDSWDWMFPIIDKINGLGKGYSFATFKTYVSCVVEKGSGKMYKDYSFANSEFITAEQTGKEAAFKLLVKFVKWHNEFIKEEIQK